LKLVAFLSVVGNKSKFAYKLEKLDFESYSRYC
jgi:hypothetical protein